VATIRSGNKVYGFFDNPDKNQVLSAIELGSGQAVAS